MFKIGIGVGMLIAWAIYPGMKNVKAKFVEWKNRNVSSAKDDLKKVQNNPTVQKVESTVKKMTSKL